MSKKNLSRKEVEEQKRREDEHAAAQVFQDFLDTFQGGRGTNESKTAKVWVKAGTYDAGSRKEDTQGKGTLYKPKSKFEAEKTKEELSKMFNLDSSSSSSKSVDRLGKKKERDRKSNLELFKEELKQIQEERYSGNRKGLADKSSSSSAAVTGSATALDSSDYLHELSSVESSTDPNTTNIYLGTVSTKVTENHLMEVFGKFGPLASVKIMWPRTEEERQRNRNCGFVAFMCRRDAERALRTLNGKTILGFEMRLGWGKAIAVPSYPVYVPPSLIELFKPPLPSGLPFNAQIVDCYGSVDVQRQQQFQKHDSGSQIWQTDEEEDEFLKQTMVKVWVPNDRKLIMLIHRVIEFVIREGPLFEALLMNREMMNPLYQFLFDNKSSAHIYYRWKLFSLLQGDSQKEWKLNDFRMFKNGSIWRPPLYNRYTDGMPDDLIEEVVTAINTEHELQRILMQTSDRDQLEHLLRHLTLDRLRIAEAMVFCIEHSDWHEEITECVAESLIGRRKTPLTRKVARLYLLSDVLHNCDTKIFAAYYYRGSFEKYLNEIMESFNYSLRTVENDSVVVELKTRVDKVLKSWETQLIYPKTFINQLFRTFYENTDYFYECQTQKPLITIIPKSAAAENRESYSALAGLLTSGEADDDDGDNDHDNNDHDDVDRSSDNSDSSVDSNSATMSEEHRKLIAAMGYASSAATSDNKTKRKVVRRKADCERGGRSGTPPQPETPRRNQSTRMTGSGSVASFCNDDYDEKSAGIADSIDEEDIDGVPIDLNDCYGSAEVVAAQTADIDRMFMRSKWEIIDGDDGADRHDNKHREGQSKLQEKSSSQFESNGSGVGGSGNGIGSSSGRKKSSSMSSSFVTPPPPSMSSHSKVSLTTSSLASSKPSISSSLGRAASPLSSLGSSHSSGSSSSSKSSRPVDATSTTGSSSSSKNKRLSESERKQLREVEIKTMQYQDDLESGKRSLKRGLTISEMVEEYRQKTLKKMCH